MKNSMVSFLVGMIAGAVIGAAVALLYAPTSGGELRTKIRTETEANMERAQAEWQKGLQGIQERLDKGQSDMNALVEETSQQEDAEPAASS